MANNKIYSQDIMTVDECNRHYSCNVQNNTFIIDGSDSKKSNKVYSEDVISINKIEPIEPIVSQSSVEPYLISSATNNEEVVYSVEEKKSEAGLLNDNNSFAKSFVSEKPQRNISKDKISNKPTWLFPLIFGGAILFVLGILFFLTTLKK